MTQVLGSAALLRLAGLPLRTLTAAAAPEIVAQLADLDQRCVAWRHRAEQVAEDIGTRLVPHPAVNATQRATALTVRRALHRGATPPAAAVRVADLAELTLPASDPLAAELRALVGQAGELAELRTSTEQAVAEEEHRLLALPWRLLHDSAAGRHAALAGDVAVYADIAARVAAGEPWHTKRMRQRSDYLWRMVTRGSTRATPRGWLAHVALLPVVPAGGWRGGSLAVLDSAAAEHVSSVYHQLPADAFDDPGAVLALAPLSRLEPDHLQVLVLTGERGTRLSALRMRRTAAFNLVLTALAAGPRSVPSLLEELAGDRQTARDGVRRLLRHLVEAGAVQVSTPPSRVLAGWRPVAAATPPVTVTDRDEYVDVYREPATGLAGPHAARLEQLVGLALRVMAMTDLDTPEPPPPLPPGLYQEPRPLLDIAAECTRERTEVHRDRPHHHDWPAPRDPGSGWARLHRWLEQRLDEPVIDLDRATLDRLDAPRPPFTWPLDVLLRPMAGTPLAVLDEISPAGVLDARFATALSGLCPELPQVDAYRRFLRRFGELAGIPLVEVLVPPLTRWAANAVRRPCYPAWWTGDPDGSRYFAEDPAQRPSHLPLSEITLRTEDGRVVAEAFGEPIWPVCHTTRSTSPPWNTVAALLNLASPQPNRGTWRGLTHSLPAWPERTHVPRITVEGGLVLSVAQWRVGREDLWQPQDRPLDKLTALVRLRRRLDLPRWVTAVTDVHDDPIAIDLDSLRAPRTLDRLAARAKSGLLIGELLPGQDELPVRDHSTGGSSVAELLLRLPLDLHPDLAAARAADQAHRPSGRLAVGTANAV